MKEEKIIVNIGENGEIHAETFGLEGVDCVDELSRLMRDIATVTADTKKPEYYKNKTTSSNTAINRQGDKK